MDETRKKVLSAILNGSIATRKSLNKYLELKEIDEQNFSFDNQESLKKTYEDFQINLYNYCRSIKEKNAYFEDYHLIEKILNREVVSKSWKKVEQKYTFYDLFRAFRNRKEHFDKINCEEEYMLFQTSIIPEEFIELYDCCNQVLDKELSKLADTEDEMLNFIANNPEIKSSFEVAMTKIIARNQKYKNESPEISQLNDEIINAISQVDLSTISMEELTKISCQFNNLFTNKLYKDEFVKNYGVELYEYLLNMFDDEISVEEYKKRIEYFFAEVLKKGKKKDE